MSKATYLTNEQTLLFGEYLLSDFRRYLKQKECQQKADLKMIDFLPWTQSLRIVSKEDLKLFKSLYAEGVRNFNDVRNVLEILDIVKK